MDDRHGLILNWIPRWCWTIILIATVGTFVFATTAAFRGTFRSYVPVTLASDRSGLVMEIDAKVKMRGVDVGRVADIEGRDGRAALTLEIDPGQIPYIPANVEAKIKVTTAFGAKFVELTPPANPSSRRLAAGAVLAAGNVTSEVNTVFENVVDLLEVVDPAKLNSVLTAVADGVRGRGERIGQAITDFNQVLLALNARHETIRSVLQSVERFGDTYNTAAADILRILDTASTTGETVVNHSAALDEVLLKAVGFATASTELLAQSQGDLITSVNNLEPTTSLLLKYEPEYTCTLQGATGFLDEAVPSVFDANGKSLILDVALQLGNDPYAYPDNLPVVAAKGGPGGKPGCGSLPDPRANFPVRQLVTDTGWGTGLDIRPNPGIGSPCWADFFPVTRGYPVAPSIRKCLPGPAPGPEPYPGAPPYGAPMYGPGGAPLFPGVPPP
ncbi:MCE family protein [Mycobacterium sp. SMC-19]|uniref:MCE family protein n=1 Tax=Mycobacterium sp. SMC-19 TaxID=3381630 RepID=UPI0038777917